MSHKNTKFSAFNNPYTPTSSQNGTYQSPIFSEKNKTQLGSVKFRRLLAEENVQLLNNKVLAWEHEETKLNKMEKDTKSKIALMLKRRIEREETQRNIREQTEQFKAQMRKTYEEKKRRVIEMREQNKEEHDYIQKENQQLIRAQREEILDRVHDNRESILMQNGQKVRKVKQQKVAGETQIDKFCKFRLDFYALERQRQIEDEERRIHEKEQVITSLSHRGNRLSDAVDRGHVKVKKVKEQYDEFSKLSTEDFLSKYPEYSGMISPDKSVSKSFRIMTGKHMSSTKKSITSERGKINTYITEPNETIEDSKPELRINSQEQNLPITEST